MSDFLVAERIRRSTGYDAEHITPDIDLVVVGNAMSRGNPELEAVLDRKVRLHVAARGDPRRSSSGSAGRS